MKKLLLIFALAGCVQLKDDTTIRKIEPSAQQGLCKFYFEDAGNTLYLLAPCDRYNVGDSVVFMNRRKQVIERDSRYDTLWYRSFR